MQTHVTEGKRESRKIGFIVFRILYGPMIYLRAVYRQVLVLLSLFIIGALIFSYFEQLPPLVALFASVSTVTIIGLFTPNNGNFTTMNKTEGILVMGLILASVTSGASVIQGLVSVAGKDVNEEATKALVSKLKGHIIVYGYDHMGMYVTDQLEKSGYDYVVVSRKPDVCDDLLSKKVFAVLESKTDPIGALRSAGIAQASLVIVTDSNDSENLRFILTARKLRPDVRIHTVVNDPSLSETASDAGANLVIASSVAVGRLLAFSAEKSDLVGLTYSEKFGTQHVTGFMIPEISPLIGRRPHEIAKGSGLIGVLRDGRIDETVFGGTFTLRKGDTLLILGDVSGLKKLEAG
ncbi:MAG TPA: NAD-binding protein [Methylomirabilota bacterium]|nr:NAD-binding protein [Methylomirabilota bacterium]